MIYSYEEKKNIVRQLAKDYQEEIVNSNYSWAEVAAICFTLENLARRYGLVKEFRENGII